MFIIHYSVLNSDPKELRFRTGEFEVWYEGRCATGRTGARESDVLQFMVVMNRF